MKISSFSETTKDSLPGSSILPSKPCCRRPVAITPDGLSVKNFRRSCVRGILWVAADKKGRRRKAFGRSAGLFQIAMRYRALHARTDDFCANGEAIQQTGGGMRINL